MALGAFKSLTEERLLPLAAPFIRRARQQCSDRNDVLIVPPSPAGSLGDSAMLQGLIDTLAEARPDLRVSQLIAESWQPLPVFHQSAADVISINQTPTGITRLCSGLAGAHAFGVLGADVMDGTYGDHCGTKRLSLAKLAARAGVPSTLLGFSISENVTPRMVSRFTQMPDDITVINRDPVSQKRFNALMGHGRAQLSADLAFLMRPRLDSASARAAAAFIQRQRADNRKIVGINANALHVAAHLREGYVAALARTVELFASAHRDVSLVFLPHDLREEQSDVTMAAQIAARLSPRLAHRSHLLRGPVEAWDVKAAASLCDFVFAGRMHVAIAALGSGVPVACATYAGKFEGLFQHFGLTAEGLLPPALVLRNPAEAAAILARGFDMRGEAGAHIQNQLGSVLAMARRNVPPLIGDLGPGAWETDSGDGGERRAA